MDACGLGKLVPNMILLGFKNDWMDDLSKVSGYINVLHHGFDVHLAVGILRLQDGCDYSALIAKEEQIIITTSDHGDEENHEEEVETENDEKEKDNNKNKDADSDDVEQGEIMIKMKKKSRYFFRYFSIFYCTEESGFVGFFSRQKYPEKMVVFSVVKMEKQPNWGIFR